MTLREQHWDTEITGGSSWTKSLRELFQYKDLISSLVKRDFIALYKQTVLGPLWVVIQPILTSLMFYIVFSRIARIDTGDIPPILFYLLGYTIWIYFADCVVKTSDTFIANQGILGKVYFPRLVIPLAIVLTNLIKFGIQMILFIVVYLVYDLAIGIEGNQISPIMFLLPLLILIMAIFGLGVGLIISALTTKYRDLKFLIQFGIQLVMFGTPVVWPLRLVPEEHHWKLLLNPMAGVLEASKVAFFGTDFGVFSWFYIGYAFVASLFFLLIGTVLFARVERTFMDTI